MYELIQHQKVDSDSANITFTNIPQNWTDLHIVMSLRGQSERMFFINFNDYSIAPTVRYLYGIGSSVGSEAPGLATAGFGSLSTDTANTFGSISLTIPNYTSSTVKSYSSDSVSESNATFSFQAITAGIWNSTAAINNIRITCRSGNIMAGSSATLYGINRTSGIGRSPQAMGGYINYANGYWYHVFNGSGSFIPFNNMQVEYVVVAGGGGSGGGTSGGGGAGGYRSSVQGELSGGNTQAESMLSLTSGTNYAIVVGAGGTAGLTDGSSGGSGTSSSFHTITTVGGGGGAHANGAISGGSGGGAGYSSGGFYAGGAGTAGQGFKGGDTALTSSSNGGAAGGGGAGEPGGNLSDIFLGGRGGNGIQSSITGTPTYRAGGGAGGNDTGTTPGGLGGGGSSIDDQNGTPGEINTGGGAGAPGTNASRSGATGGSGVVIVRYKG